MITSFARLSLFSLILTVAVGCDPPPTSLGDGECAVVSEAKSESKGSLALEGAFQDGLYISIKIKHNGSMEMHNGHRNSSNERMEFSGMPSGTFKIEQTILSGCEGAIKGMPDE